MKVVFLLLIVVAIAGVLFYMSNGSGKNSASVLGLINKNNSGPAKTVKPIADTAPATGDLLDKVKGEISKLTPDNIASSSQSIQNIINDLKLIQENKKQVKDVVCETLCK